MIDDLDAPGYRLHPFKARPRSAGGFGFVEIRSLPLSLETDQNSVGSDKMTKRPPPGLSAVPSVGFSDGLSDTAGTGDLAS